MANGDSTYVSSPEFDVEGDGYDYHTAEKFGLKPNEKGKWESRIPSGEYEGLMLKGRDHDTFAKTVAEEEAMGYEMYVKDGRDYSRPTPQRKAFEHIIRNAPSEMASIIKKVDGRTNYGLFTFDSEEEGRRYVMSSIDRWHRNPDLSIDGSLYKGAMNKSDSGKFMSEDEAWKMYQSMDNPDWEEKIMNSVRSLWE